jgi:hypothetical protein
VQAAAIDINVLVAVSNEELKMVKVSTGRMLGLIFRPSTLSMCNPCACRDQLASLTAFR